MFKSIVLAATIMFTTTQVQAADFEYCNSVSELLAAAALARDSGQTAGAVFKVGIESGIDADMMANILNLVFIEMAYDTPTEIQNIFMSYCLSN